MSKCVRAPHTARISCSATVYNKHIHAAKQKQSWNIWVILHVTVSLISKYWCINMKYTAHRLFLYWLTFSCVAVSVSVLIVSKINLNIWTLFTLVKVNQVSYEAVAKVAICIYIFEFHHTFSCLKDLNGLQTLKKSQFTHPTIFLHVVFKWHLMKDSSTCLMVDIWPEIQTCVIKLQFDL